MEHEHPIKKAYEKAEEDEKRATKRIESRNPIQMANNIISEIFGWGPHDDLREAQRIKYHVLRESQEEAMMMNSFLDWLAANEEKFASWAVEHFGSIADWKKYIISAEGDQKIAVDEAGTQDLISFVKTHSNQVAEWLNMARRDHKNRESKNTEQRADGSDDFVARDNYDRRVRQDDNY